MGIDSKNISNFCDFILKLLDGSIRSNLSKRWNLYAPVLYACHSPEFQSSSMVEANYRLRFLISRCQIDEQNILHEMLAFSPQE